jgi:hypothetical protein
MGSSLTLSFPEALFFEVFNRPGVEGDVLGYKISSPEIHPCALATGFFLRTLPQSTTAHFQGAIPLKVRNTKKAKGEYCRAFSRAFHLAYSKKV